MNYESLQSPPPSINTPPSGDEVRQITTGLFKPSATVPAAGVIVLAINTPRSDANLTSGEK